MNDFRHNYVNLTTFRLVDPEAPHTARVLRDMEIYQIQTELKLLNRTGLISVSMQYEPEHSDSHALCFEMIVL